MVSTKCFQDTGTPKKARFQMSSSVLSLSSFSKKRPHLWKSPCKIHFLSILHLMHVLVSDCITEGRKLEGLLSLLASTVVV